jgi:hypothetical protein
MFNLKSTYLPNRYRFRSEEILLCPGGRGCYAGGSIAAGRVSVREKFVMGETTLSSTAAAGWKFHECAQLVIG